MDGHPEWDTNDYQRDFQWLGLDRTSYPRLLPFEQEGFGVNKPAAWLRWYTTLSGYCREFGWRGAFLGGGCE
jgi:hypothetical protein